MAARMRLLRAVLGEAIGAGSECETATGAGVGVTLNAQRSELGARSEPLRALRGRWRRVPREVFASTKGPCGRGSEGR